ncbi:hypothetical protein BDW22DRAFT_348932 [Trametopsis cervina]|nr:hypothetical protein BDW22DRAFT_348932 [Trametopsis cervina]
MGSLAPFRRSATYPGSEPTKYFTPTREEAVDYIGLVKSLTHDDPEVYLRFTDVMRAFMLQQISLNEVIEQVTDILSPYPPLICGFYTFLPAWYDPAHEELEGCGICMWNGCHGPESCIVAGFGGLGLGGRNDSIPEPTVIGYRRDLDATYGSTNYTEGGDQSEELSSGLERIRLRDDDGPGGNTGRQDGTTGQIEEGQPA